MREILFRGKSKKNTLFGKQVMSYEVVGNIYENPEMIGDADA